MPQDAEFITRLSNDRERRIALENKNKEINEESKSMPKPESGTPETNQSSLVKSNSGELVPTPPTDSMLQSNPLAVEILRSTNSIDSSVKDLRSYMKGLFANEPNPEVQKLDLFRVETAVSCAKTINELLKTKIEAVKVAKDLF